MRKNSSSLISPSPSLSASSIISCATEAEEAQDQPKIHHLPRRKRQTSQRTTRCENIERATQESQEELVLARATNGDHRCRTRNNYRGTTNNEKYAGKLGNGI